MYAESAAEAARVVVVGEGATVSEGAEFAGACRAACLLIYLHRWALMKQKFDCIQEAPVPVKETRRVQREARASRS